MDRKNIEKIAHSTEDKILLAKVWDKINSGINKNIMTNSCFLSLREQELVRYLLGNSDEFIYFGGYDDTERKMIVYLPSYLTHDILENEDSPITCLRVSFYNKDTPSHRDFLGALTGFGIARESIGDICVGKGTCDFFVTREVAPYLLSDFSYVGHTKVQISTVSLSQAQIPEPETVQIRDTLASVRLDSIISSGFRISRNSACQYINSGKVAINGLPFEKADKTVEEKSTVSVRGLGKIKLTQVCGQTKKGRIAVIIDKYI